MDDENNDGICYPSSRIPDEEALQKLIDRFGITEIGDISAIYDGEVPPQYRSPPQRPLIPQLVKKEPLTHIERKLLTILRNYRISHKRMPPMMLLRAKTGRDDAGVKKAIQGLIDKGYARWGHKETVEHIELLREWPDEAEAPKRPADKLSRPWYEHLTDPSSPWS